MTMSLTEQIAQRIIKAESTRDRIIANKQDLEVEMAHTRGCIETLTLIQTLLEEPLETEAI